METWNRLKVARREVGRGIMVEEREGARQRTCMNDTQAWMMVWKLTMGTGLWWVE